MNCASRIVHGGGWKDSRATNIKVKAWAMLFLAILFGVMAAAGTDSFWFYLAVPASISLMLSVWFFFREKPRSIPFPLGSVGADPWKLYGAAGWQKEAHDKNDA